MSVSAKDMGTRLKNKITITNNTGRLSKSEIERMISDARKYKLEDEEYKKKVVAWNALQDYAYNMRKAIRRSANRAAADKKKMEDAYESFKQWRHFNEHAEADDFKEKMKELEYVFDPIINDMD